MKLGKISLAAVVALGAFSTSAFAKDLSDAIKGVDVSGEIQYRYDNRNTDGAGNDGAGREENHEFDASIMFKVPVSDNMKAVVDVIYSQDNDVHPEDSVDFHSEESGNSEVYIDNLYFAYTTGKTTVMLGQMAIGAPFTDDMMMNGIKVLNSDLEGFTFAAVYSNNLEEDGDSAAMGLVNANGEAMNASDLYTVAAIGSMGPVNGQVWYSHIPNALDGLVWLQADAKFDPVKIEAQYAKTMLDEDIDVANGGERVLSDADYYAIKISGKIDPVTLFAGYTFKETDEEGAISFSTIEDYASTLRADKLLTDGYSDTEGFSGEHTTWFLGVNGKVSGVGLGLAYTALDIDDAMEASEITLTAKTKFEGLSIKPYYAWANIDPEGSDDYDDNKFRVDVEYKF